MDTLNYPVLLCATSVSLYWFIVFIKVVLITPKIGKTPNIIPKEAWGFFSRLIMLPLIVFWIYLPWQYIFINTSFFLPIAYIGAGCSVFALATTVYCWYYMGTAWRIGINPKEKNILITAGPFKWVRHPIYALSMLLMLATFLSVQTKPVFFIFCIHWVIFYLEAYREEQYLSGIHGEKYQEYLQQTSRFFPLYFWR